MANTRGSQICRCELIEIRSVRSDHGSPVVQLLDIFKLVDQTDDEGPIWDTKGHVVPTQYWDNPEKRRKIWHDKERSWLNFRGKWGNRGGNDCWWHKLVGICQVGRSTANTQSKADLG